MALLKLLVGIDFAGLVGYHDHYLDEAIMETGASPASVDEKARKGVRWFTVQDLKTLVESMTDGSEPVATAVATFKEVIDQFCGLDSIALRNLPVGTVEKKDIVIACNQFNIFPLLAFIFNIPYSGLRSAGTGETPSAPTSP